MKTTQEILSQNKALASSLRVLTGASYSGKRAIYISGTPDGLRLLAQLLNAQADAADGHFTKLEREASDLYFTTDDSVEVFEMHTTAQPPKLHEPPMG